jgi:hypothetical protein
MRATIAELTRRRHTPAPEDENLRAARTEFYNAVHRYHLERNRVVESQKTVKRYVGHPVYELAFDMAKILEEPPSTQDLLDAKYGGRCTGSDIYYLRKPEFSDVPSYRAAIAWISDEAFTLERKSARVAEVARFGSADPTAQLNLVVAALLKRIDRIDRRVTAMAHALDERFEEIDGRLDRMSIAVKQRRNRNASRKANPTA